MLQARALALATAAGLGVLSAPAPVAAQDFKGQIKIGIHKLKLEAGKIYAVVLDSKCSDAAFPIVQAYPGQLTQLFGNTVREDTILFIPAKTDEYAFYVASPLGAIMEDVVDYTLSVRPIQAAEKPVLKEKVTIDAKDPLYEPRKSRHKVITLDMKANTCYIIDLVRTGKQDPYLYLEDGAKTIVSEDDESGGDFNSRIVYRPAKDGKYRIIATTLDNTLGDMHLTVRAVPLKK